ncbi:MAG: SIR2 family protein [Alphaproteobacteria bacterium]|nr:SIR2 family protein [Alphaproteobacteria bacterium]
MPQADRELELDKLLTVVENLPRGTGEPQAHRPLLDPIQSVERWFGLKRYMTLNFDYQLERALLLDDHVAMVPPPADVETATVAGILRHDENSGTLDRLFSDGLLSASDLYRPQALGRLFEFGLNSPDYHTHVLHLHGRADHPDSMLLTDTDSNRQYRRDPEAADLLEHALDVALTGNPILFMGVGLGEPEITRALRELVSRSDSTPEQPAFTTQMLPFGAVQNDASGWRLQQSQLRQNGIHVFAVGGTSNGVAPEIPRSAGNLHRQLHQLPTNRPEPAPDLVFSQDILMKLEALTVKMSIQRVLRTERFPITAAARKSWFADVNSLWMDNSAFLYLLDQIDATATTISASTANSWLDYLGALRKKSAALAQLNRLRGLRDAIESRFRSPLLASKYLHKNFKPMASRPRGLSPRIRYTPPVSIRDQQFAKQTANSEWTTRHGRAVQSAPALPAHGLPAAALLLITGDMGSGKGSLSASIRQQMPVPGLFINLSFGIEIDSVVSHILCFIVHRCARTVNGLGDRITQIRMILATQYVPVMAQPIPILLSGVERMFDRDCQVVAAEFQLLLQALLHPHLTRAGFRLILLGTRHIEPALAAMCRGNGTSLTVQPIDTRWQANNLANHINRLVQQRCQSRAFLHSLRLAMEQAMAKSAAPLVAGGVRSRQTSAVLALVFRRWHDLHDIKRSHAELDRAVLGALALIGMPIEAEGLLPMPAIASWFATATQGPDAAVVIDSLQRLDRYGLVAELEARERSSGKPRYALHRTVLAELRENLSARSGEEPISNSFSITLAASMPTDLKLPDTHVLEELDQALGRLRGAWKDPGHFDPPLSALRAAAEATWKNPLSGNDISQWRDLEEFERAVRMCDKPMAIYQRAAAGIIRGFFSGASLVGHFPTGQAGPKLGRMEHHKRRIGLLLQQVRDSQQAGRRAIQLASRLDSKLPQAGIRTLAVQASDKLKANATPFALYGNEILWLLNEQAVIAIIQGCLLDAQKLLDLAETANRNFRSERPGTITWRRLEINRAFVFIERGQIAEARSRLLAIAPAVNERQLHLTHEDELTAPLITSYIGLCDHLAGRYDDAAEKFEQAIEGARRTGQQRAQAISQIRLAALRFHLGQTGLAAESIRDAIAIAQNGRQMDIVWRAKTTSCTGLRNQNRRQEVDDIVRHALDYAQEMGIPRLRVEALKQRGELALALGDLGTAAKATAAAMAVATRHGMVLHRISLRILMGRILLQKQDKSGKQMLDRAAILADRIGYQLMVERALAAANQPTRS